jgi:GNAT superfamily N-acetyltransferase
MATAAVGSRVGVLIRSTTDRHLLREYLEQDRLFAAYAICDLAEREFPRTRWGIATHGDRLVAVGMEYSGLTPQPMFVMGEPDGIAGILRDVVKPRAAYIAAKPESLPAVASHYKVDPGPQMIRMWVDRGTFQPLTSRVDRLLPVEVHELNRLYQLGFAAWLPSSAIAEGVYYGIRVNGRLVAAAGTHVISREAGLAVVGNVLTHADHRGRGYAKAVTSAVTAELLRSCDQVVLNVRADNPPAIAAYDRLGYREHCRFEERLVRRTTPTWPDLVAPIRRLFAGRRASPAPVAPTRFEQAHPIRPADPVDPAASPVEPEPGIAPPDDRGAAAEGSPSSTTAPSGDTITPSPATVATASEPAPPATAMPADQPPDPPGAGDPTEERT